MNVVWVALVASFLLLVWLNTNAFVEYITLLRYRNLFKLEEYEKLRDEGYPDNYISFLREYYKDYFWVRLLSCPICVSTWIGILYSLCFGIYPGFAVAPLTLFFYLVFNRIM